MACRDNNVGNCCRPNILLHDAAGLEAFTGFTMIPYGIGVAIYAFEGIGMLVSMKAEADKKQET